VLSPESPSDFRDLSLLMAHNTESTVNISIGILIILHLRPGFFGYLYVVGLFSNITADSRSFLCVNDCMLLDCMTEFLVYVHCICHFFNL